MRLMKHDAAAERSQSGEDYIIEGQHTFYSCDILSERSQGSCSFVFNGM